MTKHTSCSKSSSSDSCSSSSSSSSCSSSSSSSSERCYKVRCEKKCGSECCSIEDCERYCPEELYCKYNAAVVSIHAEFILVGASGGTALTGGSPLGFNSRVDVILNGNGFMLGKGIIVTAARNVLMPPALTSSVNRFPASEHDGFYALGQIRNDMIRASRILVGIQDVNRKGHAFSYEVDLLGVDGIGDIAVLRVNCKKQWNQCNPRIQKCHPHFKWGKSRATKDGEPVYMFGDFVTSQLTQRRIDAAGAIVEGIVSDHRYVDYQGLNIQELLLVSSPAYAFSAGLPFINAQGEVIGMQTCDVVGVLPALLNDPDGTVPYLNQSQGSGMVAGPTQYFMERVIKTIIRGICSKKFNAELENICDPVGAYYRYLKGYLGIAYDLVTAETYDYTVDFTSAAANTAIPINGRPRIRLNADGTFNQFPNCKEIIGIRILGLAGANPDDGLGVANGFYFVPGATGTAPLPAFLPVSPLLTKLVPGNIITHLEGVALGDLIDQIAPSLVTYRLQNNDLVKICYRVGGNALNTADNGVTENYDNLYEYISCVETYPRALDYPYCSTFPQVLTSDATPLDVNRILVAAGQAVNPQVIQRSTATLATQYRPAI